MTYDVGTLSAARLWPYQPDFSGGYEVRRAFLTDIVTSRANREQRRGLRDTARLSASYSTVVEGDDLQAAKHYLRAWQNKPAAIPDFSRFIASSAGSLAGDSTLTIDVWQYWIAIGFALVLCSADALELVEITDFDGTTITLAAPLVNTWPTGSIIRPALHGLLGAQLQAQRLTRGAQRLSVALNVYPGGEPFEDEGTPSVTFNDYEVFTAEQDFASPPSINYLWPVEQVDYGFGRTAQFRPLDRAEQMIEAQFSGLSRDEAQAIEQVFLRARGMRGAFYRPSCEKDMTLAADVSASAIMDIAGSALAADFGSIDYSANFVAIEIVQTDGTRLHQRITAIVTHSGNSRITLDSPVTLTLATTARISWMPLVRFASDELATTWRTMATASIAAAFQTVKQ